VRTRKVLRTTLLVTTLKLRRPTSGAIVGKVLEGIRQLHVIGFLGFKLVVISNTTGSDWTHVAVEMRLSHFAVSY
jgi:hypothetical protein